MSREWRFYVDDMAAFCEKVMAYTQNCDLPGFVAAPLVYDATLRNLELIGEAAMHVPEDVRHSANYIDWRRIVATRNRLIHGYLGIDNDTLWSIIHKDVPLLLGSLHRLKQEIQADIPVIAIDGPSASGKGTVAQRVAETLGFHFLDSGALYRLTALAAIKRRVALEDEVQVAKVAHDLDVSFAGGEIYLDGELATEAIRAEEVGNGASKIAAMPAVRAALLERQRAFRQDPGLVADGRDMGSVVFPDAKTKIFLTASAEVRAERRYKQLMAKGIHANLPNLLQDLKERDARDTARSVAPLQQCADASLLDTSGLTIDEAVAQVLASHRASA